MLYKYVNYERANALLTTKQIRFTQPSDFNDPFELHPEFQLMSREDIADLPPALDESGNVIAGMRQLTPEALQRMMSAVMPHLARMAPVHAQHPGASFAIDNNAVGREYYDQHFGILSLTESPDNLLMWAHYGDNHKGVVIGFDEQHLFFKGAEIVVGLNCLNKVEYNQKRPVLSPTTQKNPKVFLRKSTEWAYEKEWRLIRSLNAAATVVPKDNIPSVYLFDVPVEAIRVIITGSQMQPDQYQEICALRTESADLQHMKIHHAQLSKEEYALEIHPALTEEEERERLKGKAMSAKSFDI